MTSRISSIPGAAANAATQCSTSVLPSRASNCLGSAAPNRVPAPPPSTTATMRFTITSADFTWCVAARFPKESGAAGYAEITAPYQCRSAGRGGGMTGHLSASRSPHALYRLAAAHAVPDLRWLRGDRGAMADRRLGARRDHRARRGGRRRRLRPFRPGARRPAPGHRVEWGLAGYGMLAEFVIYAGDRRGGQLARRAHSRAWRRTSLRGTFVASSGRRGRRRGVAAGDHRGDPRGADADGGPVRARPLAAGRPGCACSGRPATSGCRWPAAGPGARRPGGLPRRARAWRRRARRDDHRRHPPAAGPRRAARLPRATAGSRSGSASGSAAGCRRCRRCSSGCSSPAC